MLTEDIQKKAIQHLVNTTGCDGWALSGITVTARHCKVYQLSCPKYPKNIALKNYNDKQTSRQLKGQYGALERFSDSINQTDTKFRTPEPYGCFAENGFFLMEWVSAPSLDTTLWRSVFNHKGKQTAIEATYGWLKQYHQAAAPVLQEINLNLYHELLARHIELHNGQELQSTNPTFAKGIDTFKKVSTAFTGLQFEHADAHGDFTPTNILIGKNDVTGIDIGGGQKMPIENDMALMLNYITIDFFNILTRRHMKKPVSTWAILNITLDAYNYPKDQKQRYFFLFVFLYQTLRRWLVINERNRKKVRLLDKWRLRNSESIVEGLSKVLLESSQT